MENKHPEEESTEVLKCGAPGCDYETRLIHYLRSHRRTHRQELKCATCDFKTTVFREHQKHLKVHPEERTLR